MILNIFFLLNCQVSPRKRQRKTGTVEKPQLNINSTIEEGETRDEISVGTDDENVFKLPHSATLPSSMTDSGSRPAGVVPALLLHLSFDLFLFSNEIFL